jgi:thiol-disulfide isomerase/thioredoxin
VRSLVDLRGAVVVLDFWATWCGVCIRAFPDVRALQEHYQDRNVHVISVTWLQGTHYERGRPPTDTSGDSDLEYRLMAGFVEKMKISWPVAFADGEAIQNYGLMMTGVPHLTIIDHIGVVRYDGVDVNVPLEKKLEIIDSLLTAAGPDR